MRSFKLFIVIAVGATMLSPTGVTWAGGVMPDMIERQVRQLSDENLRNFKKIEDLERELKEFKNQNNELQKTNQQTVVQLKTLESKVEAGPSPTSFQGFLDSYWGERRFVLTGYASGTFEYDRNNSTNTFVAGFNPIFLFRLSDWMTFEGEIEVGLPSDGETEINLEYAQTDVFLNDHLQLAIGKMLVPR